jgi:hypothetical protein
MGTDRLFSEISQKYIIYINCFELKRIQVIKKITVNLVFEGFFYIFHLNIFFHFTKAFYLVFAKVGMDIWYVELT